jgi:hypothetical protein
MEERDNGRARQRKSATTEERDNGRARQRKSATTEERDKEKIDQHGSQDQSCAQVSAGFLHTRVFTTQVELATG